jgi:hypothetical protein
MDDRLCFLKDSRRDDEQNGKITIMMYKFWAKCERIICMKLNLMIQQAVTFRRHLAISEVRRNKLTKQITYH